MADEHKGHRQRMRERAVKEGLSNFHDHELLELLLYPYIPYKDTNELAHRLLGEFGSLQGVFEADIDSLLGVKGMTNNAAFYISMTPDVFRRYHIAKLATKPVLSTTAAMVNYLEPFMSTLTREEIYLVTLDAKFRFLGIKLLSQGVVSESSFYIRDVVEEIVKKNAVYVVLAHNHPSGSAEPSKTDIDMTARLVGALSGIGVTLIDHIIITIDGYYSFKTRGLIDDMRRVGSGKIFRVGEEE
ncbi:MAG: DNA repair protein RadC [Clostridia bacterium]|nr:DNA repair protein RadC [Clostridia bacterium]